MRKQYIRLFIFLYFMLTNYSCSKFLDVGLPPNGITDEHVFSSDETAISAMVGVYKIMHAASAFSGGNAGLSYQLGLYADELRGYSSVADFMELYKNGMTEGNQNAYKRWSEIYNTIYNLNAVINSVSVSNVITDEVKKRLDGEARMFRAFCYFYLLNLFGDVPLVLDTDFRQNKHAARKRELEVYAHIIDELKISQQELDDNYLDKDGRTSADRIRPNRGAATALLSRIYLYQQQYANAEAMANLLINDKQHYELVPLRDVFLRGSKCMIWQLEPSGKCTWDGDVFILSAPPSPSSLYGGNTTLTTQLVNSFEPGDMRRSAWIGTLNTESDTYYYPNKYKNNARVQLASEYLCVLRLAEVYLIRAEARIAQGNIENGIRDLNALRKRARALPTLLVPDPLPDLPLKMSKEQALLAVEQERRHELFTEMGHRFLDLKRTNRADAVLGMTKGALWQPTDKLWPLPLMELNLNPDLKPQNPGYR